MALVKLILRDEVPNLGDTGDLVSVKPGFARNYLLPSGKAILATEARVREVEHHKRVVAERMARQLKDLRVARDRLQGTVLSVEVQAGEGGRLFGSVTAIQIAELLAAQGFEVDRRKIQLTEPIKQVGEHKVPVRLHKEVVAEVKLVVTSKEAAAEAAAEAEPAPKEQPEE
jgi:large subunit ribosomal protein L9